MATCQLTVSVRNNGNSMKTHNIENFKASTHPFVLQGPIVPIASTNNITQHFHSRLRNMETKTYIFYRMFSRGRAEKVVEKVNKCEKAQKQQESIQFSDELNCFESKFLFFIFELKIVFVSEPLFLFLFCTFYFFIQVQTFGLDAIIRDKLYREC